MKIITKSPILVNPENSYSYLDGGSAQSEIQAFQKWVWYVKGDKSLKTSKAPDGVDGIFGKKTSLAWTKYGDEYTKSLAVATSISSAPTTQVQSSPQVQDKPTEAVTQVQEKISTEVETEAKASWWKKRTKMQKGLIIGGAIAVVGLTVFLIVRSKNKVKTVK